jgi:beta-N-acetylhexosaminidase
MLDLADTTLSVEEARRLRNPLVGGVILFSRNYDSREQLRELVKSIHAAADRRLLVAVDQEGGRVQRFRHDFTHLPPLARFGEIFEEDQDRALALTETAGWIMAAELRAVGIDFSFAPILDLKRGVSHVIGDRAFHRRPATVSRLAQAYMRGMREAGMAAVGKHFPGHGSVVADSHHELPMDERILSEIEERDLIPFSRLSEATIPALMTAHIVFNKLDSNPVTFSPFWLQEILRDRLKFNGAIFSDDLNMSACGPYGTPVERMQKALRAGCDMVLYCNNPEAVGEILEKMSTPANPAYAMRLVRMHGLGSENEDDLVNSARWKQAVAAMQALDQAPELDMDT